MPPKHLGQTRRHSGGGSGSMAVHAWEGEAMFAAQGRALFDHASD
jgi:hypothetical protein